MQGFCVEVWESMEISGEDLQIVERYLFLDKARYRVQVKGTNIVFNIQAESDEEAIRKSLELASRVGLTRDLISEIRKNIQQ